MDDGIPRVIVENGTPIDKALAIERLPLDEVMEAALQHGIEHLEDVRLAVLEATGRISLFRAESSSG